MKKSRAFPFSRTLIATAAITSLSAFAQQEATQLDVVTVTAGGYEQSVKDAPASISVITADEIAKKSYTDVTDVLRNVPGVHIQGGGVEQSVTIRGMGADYTKFLIDGRAQQDNQAFGLNGSSAGSPVNFLPPLDAIERIEVIRGPASSLYGSDAMGGVVNIITKKVVNKFSGSVSTEYIKSGNDMTNDGLNGNFALNIPVVEDKLSLQINGGIRNQDEANYVGGDDSRSADPEFKRRNFEAKLGLKIDPKNTVTLGVGRTEQERWKNPGKSLARQTWDNRNKVWVDVDATYTKNVKNNVFLTHEGRYKDMLWESYISYDNAKNPTRVNANTGNSIEFETLNANTQATFFLGEHSLTTGLNYKKEDLRDGATNAVSNEIKSLKRESYALFVEDNWQLTDDLAVLLSGRYDYTDSFGSHISPKIYAVYDVNDNLAFKGGYTTGYKAPSLRQAAPDFAGGSMGGATIGNPDLQPEKSQNFELGLAYTSSDSKFVNSLTAFKTNFKDKIQRSLDVYCVGTPSCSIDGINYPGDQANGYTQYSNIDEATIKGLEWTFDWKVAKDINYRHSYTYTKSEQKSGAYDGKPLNDIPKHMLNMMLDWDVNAKTNLWVQANYRGESAGAWSNKSAGNVTPSYTFLDVGVKYAVNKDVDLKFGVYNLTNKEIVPSADNSAPTLDGRRYSLSAAFRF